MTRGRSSGHRPPVIRDYPLCHSLAHSGEVSYLVCPYVGVRGRIDGGNEEIQGRVSVEESRRVGLAMGG